MIEIVDEQERFEHCMGDTVFVLRRMGVETHAEIVRRHTRRMKACGEWVVNLNEQAVLLDTIDYIILDWSGVHHPATRQAVACTTENKRRLPIVVMEELIEVIKDATRAAAQEVREDLKNLNGSSS